MAPETSGMSSGEWKGDDEFECPTCGDVFDTEDALREHATEQHGDE